MYATSFEISAFLLSVFCFLYCLIAKRRQYIPPKGLRAKLTNQHFLFLMMLLTNMLSSISSVVGVYLTELHFEGITFWQYFFHALYFVFHSTLSLTFALYIMSVTGTSFKKKLRFLNVLIYVPYLASEVMVLTNHWTNWCFFMDENSIYHRGPLMLLLYAFGAFYVVLGFVVFVKNVRAISKGDRAAVGSFIVIATAGIVVQAIKSDILIELFAESLACLVIMIVLEEKSGHIDPTTGLLNRIAFLDAMRRVFVNKESCRIIILKLSMLDDVFKRLPGRIEDDFLMQLGTFLSREDRLGGDIYCYRREAFAIVTKENSKEEAERYATSLLERFHSPFNIEGETLVIDAIAAVIDVPKDVDAFADLEDVLTLNYNKTKAGSYLVPFDELRELTKRKFYESAIKEAIKKNYFVLYYQPIYSTKKGKTLSAEALLRVKDGPLKTVSPDIYIPIAEESGLIKEIGLFVFEEVVSFLSRHQDDIGLDYIELNLSMYQFKYGDLVTSFEDIRNKYGVDAKRINLEVTETGGALENDDIISALDRFLSLGYTLSLDDFGTGYSNLMRMIKINFENIKIDKSILYSLFENEEDKELLKSLMTFIKSLGSHIVQEGVETKEQLDLVSAWGADYIQGYYFSPAIPEDDFLKYLAERG